MLAALTDASSLLCCAQFCKLKQLEGSCTCEHFKTVPAVPAEHELLNYPVPLPAFEHDPCCALLSRACLSHPASSTQIPSVSASICTLKADECL